MTSFLAARQLLAVGGVGLALALAGCATAPTPAPSTTVAVAPTPTPTPEPTVIEEVPAAAVVVVAADLLEVRDESGATMFSLSYRSLTADAVAALTSVFGAPAQERFEAGNDHGGGVRYIWPG